MKRITLSLIAILIIVLFAGCGGGGSGHKERGSISGTVTDVAGNLIPGASVLLDDREVGTTAMNGTFKLTGVTPGYHNIEVIAYINNKEWYGTRAIDVYSDGPTMNMNVIIGAWDNMGVIEGTVKNLNNTPLPNARVIAIARYPQDRAADEASVVSKVVRTNSNGRYYIEDLPATITVNGVKQDIIYDVVASFAGQSGEPGGYTNVTKTATLSSDPDAVTIVDFTLQASDQSIPSVPPGWTDADATYVLSYTVPTRITTRAAENAYDAVKASISQRTRKAIAARRHATAKRSAPSGALIENDLVWYGIWNSYYGIDIPDNLAGFSIFRNTRPQLTKSDQYRIDFVRDPSIVTYADTSSELTPGVTYYYGAAAVSTSYMNEYDEFNPNAESAISYPASVTPLGKLTVTSPSDGAQVSVTNPVFRWNSVAGAETYKVFIYEDYPIFDSMFTPQGDPARPDHLPSWGQSASVTGTSVTFNGPDFRLVRGRTYYWVVIAADYSDFDWANAYSISELRSFVAR